MDETNFYNNKHCSKRKNLAGIYLFKINDINTKTMCEIC